MNEGICDFRFAICDLAATCRVTGSGHDRGQFTGFLPQSSAKVAITRPNRESQI
jgi:hypothetical protein